MHIFAFYDLYNVSKLYDFYQCYLMSYVTITNVNKMRNNHFTRSFYSSQIDKTNVVLLFRNFVWETLKILLQIWIIVPLVYRIRSLFLHWVKPSLTLGDRRNVHPGKSCICHELTDSSHLIASCKYNSKGFLLLSVNFVMKKLSLLQVLQETQKKN